MATKQIGAKVIVKGKEGTIVGSEFPTVGTKGIKWRVKLASGSSAWYSDDQVKVK